MSRSTSRLTVPVIAQADVLVVESTLDGCFLAERIARHGRAAVLTSTGTSLPREVAMGLRPWVGHDALARAPDDVRSYLNSCRKKMLGDEIVLDMIKVTEGMEDRLLDAGAGLFYDLHPCGVQIAGGRVTAVIFACKGGLVAVEAGAVIDCTPDARVAALAGAELVRRKSADKGAVVRYSMLCEGPPAERVLAVEGVPELVDGQVLMHGDFAEFRVRVPPPRSLFHESVHGLEARRVAARVAAVLRESDAWKTTFVRGGDVVLADPMVRVVSRSAGKKLSVEACRPRGIDNLLVCSPAADVDDAVAVTLVEPLGGPSLAQVIEEAPWGALGKGRAEGERKVRLSVAPLTRGGAAGAEARFVALDPVYGTDAGIRIGETPLPVVAACEVVVVGGGTSGMPAAMVAAEKGADTVLVEKYGDVGGTHTIGGVSRYWFGRRTEFVERLDSDAGAMMKRTGMPKCMGMLNSLMKAGTRVVTHCLAVGALVEGRALAGIVVVSPEGLGIVEARLVVDATGDGDIAARAGARTDYGTRRDAMTLWYSFARFSGTNPEAARHFDCVVDPRDPADATRAMISSRRRGRARGPDDFPQYYLTPRESRHIRGGCTVTVADILAGRRFEDVVLVCEANFDIKGIADSDLTFSGYVERRWRRNYSVQIPFRALVPTELANILVIGKAYSVTHDALALARMQRDLMAMGGAAGLAAARAVGNDASITTVDVRRLQEGLVELGVLSAADLESVEGVEDNELPRLGEGELRRMIGRLAGGEVELDGKVKILVRREQSVPLLREALSKADGAGGLEVARALCFLGDESGAAVLLTELERQLAARGLPSMKRWRHKTPDHGFAPEATYLINTLGRLRDARVIPIMTEVAKRVEMNPEVSDPMFNWVFSVCYAAERLADPSCLEALTILAGKPGIRGGALPRGTDPRETAGRRADRYAYLELCVGRALARCGSRRGYEILLEYLEDIRAVLARSAHDELVGLSGRDLGYAPRAWQDWLASATPAREPYR